MILSALSYDMRDKQGGLIEVKHLLIPEHLLKRDCVGDVKRVDMREKNTFHRPVVVNMDDYRIRIQSEVAHRIRILKRKGLM